MRESIKTIKIEDCAVAIGQFSNNSHDGIHVQAVNILSGVFVYFIGWFG